MAEEKLLTIRDTANVLGLTEKEIIELAESGVLPAYRIGGVYLRFKYQQVEDYKKKNKLHAHKHSVVNYSLGERLSDFFYFNDFYILSFLIVVGIIVIILRGSQ